METTSTLPRPAFAEFLRSVDWNAVSTWLLGFGLILYLGLKGGGYDPLVHDQAGIAVWWILLATVAVGALPRRRPTAVALVAVGLLAAFVIWTALSLGWTESHDKTAADVARVTTYLGVFVLAIFAHGRRSARRMVAAVGAGVVSIAIVALLSRLHPSWFPEATQTDAFLGNSEDRLSYPLDYWNGLAALLAIGLPAVLQIATCARSIVIRAFAGAALPALMLTLYFTISRGGIAAATLALAVFIALTSDRLPKLATLLVAGAGGSILIAAASQRDALHEGLLGPAAQHQGNEMLAMTLVVCAGVGLVQTGISIGLTHGLRPRWSEIGRRQALAGLVAGAIALLLTAVVAGAPGRISSAWTDFKSEGGPGSGVGRLDSTAGESRYQFWSSALREEQSKPLTGTGSGTFEYWWDRDGDTPEVVRDTHSMYMQTLGELGIVGIVLVAGFAIFVLGAGVLRTVSAGSRGRPQLAAALAGCVAFFFTAAFDWMWQLPVLPVALLLLASAFLGASPRTRGFSAPLPVWMRAVFAVLALCAIFAIAIPLSSTSLLRQSQADARAAHPAAALDAARTAQNVQTHAAGPRLQQALVLEGEGELAAGRAAARAATERGATNWKNWLVLSRIEAEEGNAKAAVRHYRRARELNPRSPLFAR